MSTYYFAKRVALPFEEAVAKVTALLKDEGFGVLTEIDVRDTLKKKLDVDFRPYPRLVWVTSPWMPRVKWFLGCAVVISSKRPLIMAGVNSFEERP